MTALATRLTTISCSIAAATLLVAAKPFDRRVVDTAEAGNAESEWSHGYVGDSVTTGMFNGQSFRQARGYMRYALKTFDDTPVTVACTFVGTDRDTHSYDVIVEDSVIATRTFTSLAATATVVEIRVPFSLTRGRTNIAVIVRARGGTTPALREVRTIQDHNELDQRSTSSSEQG
jgi:hypothetical protein